MLIKKRILILGPFGEVGGVRTHAEILQSIMQKYATKIKITRGSPFFHMVVERLCFRPDVVIYNLSIYRNQIIRNMIARTIMTSRNTKHILHIHGGVFSNIRLAMNPFWKVFLKYYLKGFDQIFCLTDEQYSAIKSRLGDLKNVKKVRNYVEIPDRKLLDKSDQNLNLLYIGRLHPKKGIMDTVGAVQKLNEAKIKLWIIGAGELEAQLAEIQDPRIVFLGRKFGEDKNSFLSKAHVFLLPTSWPEGLPYALLEAAAHGLALIATPVGAINKVLFHGENGFFVEAGNVSMIAQTLETFINDRALALQMGEESRRICKERFALKNLQQIYDNVFKKWNGGSVASKPSFLHGL